MGQRLKLQTLLESITPHVYFQPPANLEIEYPCIVYKRYEANTIHADNQPWRTIMCYQITVIDADPDSEIPGKVALLPSSAFQRHFTSDNLNHDIYNLYY